MSEGINILKIIFLDYNFKFCIRTSIVYYKIKKKDIAGELLNTNISTLYFFVKKKFTI